MIIQTFLSKNAYIFFKKKPTKFVFLSILHSDKTQEIMLKNTL